MADACIHSECLNDVFFVDAVTRIIVRLASCCRGLRLWHPDQSVEQQDGARLLQCPKWVQGACFAERQKLRHPSRAQTVQCEDVKPDKKWSPAIYTRMHTRRRESHDSLWRWFKRPGEMWRQWVTILCFWLVSDLVIKLSVSWMNDQGGWCSGTALTYKSIIKEPCPASPCPGFELLSILAALKSSVCGEPELCIKH